MCVCLAHTHTTKVPYTRTPARTHTHTHTFTEGALDLVLDGGGSLARGQFELAEGGRLVIRARAKVRARAR